MSATLDAMKELHGARRALVKYRVARRNRDHTHRAPLLQRQARARLRVLGISPRKRRSPPRLESAVATDVILLCTSNPTNVVASMRPVSYA